MINNHKKHGAKAQPRQLWFKFEFGDWLNWFCFRQCSGFEWMRLASDPFNGQFPNLVQFPKTGVLEKKSKMLLKPEYGEYIYLSHHPLISLKMVPVFRTADPFLKKDPVRNL